MNIVFWGTPSICVPIMNKILESKHKIVAVVTQPDRRRSRGNRIDSSPVKEKALTEGIPIYTPSKIKLEEEIQQAIKSYEADINIVIAYGQILPTAMLEAPQYGSWNIHASLLPNWRGAAPIEWSLLKGDKKTGVSIMKMEEGLDTGDILLEEEVEIGLLDNAKVISTKISYVASQLIIKAIDEINSYKDRGMRLKDINLTNQNDLNRQISYARKIEKSDFKINWNFSALEIHRQVCALHPNAYTFYGNKRVKIIKTIPIHSDYTTHYPKYNVKAQNYSKYKAGEIIGKLDKYGFLVKTIDSPLLVLEAKIEGKSLVAGNSLIQQFTSSSQNQLK